MTVNLTTEQQQQLWRGMPVEVGIGGELCVLLTREAFDRVKGSEVETSTVAGACASMSI